MTRAIVALAVLSMAIAFFVPLWEILLWAPQYPEGLQMYIWLNHLSGDVEIINGLNHYIGMAEIHEQMFPEFGFMGYVLIGIILFGLVPAITGKYKWLIAFVAFLALCGGVGLWDFWHWSYNYGHNLDPKAAIQVPGMSYSPPLLGYKALLNFVAYSGPAIGGWILISAGTLTGGMLFWEILRRRKKAAPAQTSSVESTSSASAVSTGILMITAGGLLSSCNATPVAIDYGHDECASCQMLISDAKFAAEWITEKGKIYKFDDLGCLYDFITDEHLRGQGYMTSFEANETFLSLDSAMLLQHPGLRSPMRSHIAAFSDPPSAEAIADKLGRDQGKLLTWADFLHGKADAEAAENKSITTN